MSWLFYALVSAAAAAATAILAKIGVQGVPATLATAIRTGVVLIFAWLMVAQAGELRQVTSISRPSMFFLGLSGIATGISWLAYFRALQLGPASRVAPIDKLSLPLTAILPVLVLSERLTWPVGVGITLMTIGALVTLL